MSTMTNEIVFFSMNLLFIEEEHKDDHKIIIFVDLFESNQQCISE